MLEMMMGAKITEEIWWDGTDLMECGNHSFFMSEDETLYRILTDADDRVIEIEKV